MRNLQEQVKKAFCYQKFFWPNTVWNYFLNLTFFLQQLEKKVQNWDRTNLCRKCCWPLHCHHRDWIYWCPKQKWLRQNRKWLKSSSRHVFTNFLNTNLRIFFSVEKENKFLIKYIDQNSFDHLSKSKQIYLITYCSKFCI